jgi:hypothetical protein
MMRHTSLPDDLKNFRAPRFSFGMSPAVAERLLVILGALAWIADMLGWLG